MANPQNIEKHKFKPGQSGNPRGHAKGVRNRSTIAREVLALNAKFPDKIFQTLKEQYPALEKEMSIEQMMAVVLADKAIRKQDVAAYIALLDSAYGKARQEVDLTSKGESLKPLVVTVATKKLKQQIDSL